MLTHSAEEITGAGGLAVHWQRWLPAASPRAVVVIAHGVAEHGGRYAHVASAFAAADLATYAIDHRGHGRSGGARSNLGRMAWTVQDLDAVVQIARTRHPATPVFLLGHSLGGLIALQYATGEHQLAGLITTGAAVDVTAANTVQKLAARLLSAVAPDFGVITIDPAAVSRDPQVVRDYDTDPLNHRGRIAARTGAEALATLDTLPRRLAGLTLPVLILHGTADRLATAAGSRMVHDRCASPDRRLRLFDGLYHEILNEPERDDVLNEIIGWVTARC